MSNPGDEYAAFAKRGRVFVLGSLGWESEDLERSGESSGGAVTTTFTFSPQVGHFVTENFSIAALFEYQSVGLEAGGDEVELHSMAFGLDLRFWHPLGPRTLVHFGGVVAMTNVGVSTNDDSADEGGVRAAPGFGFAFTTGGDSGGLAGPNLSLQFDNTDEASAFGPAAAAFFGAYF